MTGERRGGEGAWILHAGVACLFRFDVRAFVVSDRRTPQPSPSRSSQSRAEVLSPIERGLPAASAAAWADCRSGTISLEVSGFPPVTSESVLPPAAAETERREDKTSEGATLARASGRRRRDDMGGNRGGRGGEDDGKKEGREKSST